MAHTSRNFVVAYIFLVGLPLLALVGVLRSGRHISAPYSVDGAWNIETDTQALNSFSCQPVSVLLRSPLVISQSGTTLQVSFGRSGAPALGTLDGKTINASMPAEPSQICGNGHIVLSAALDPRSQPRSLTGSISLSDCRNCGPLPFKATKQSKPQSGGMH